MEINVIKQVGADAQAAFDQGLYCAESVLVALAKAQGLNSELIPKVATAFCSGMARTCGTCGALTGAMMGVSLKLGRSEAGLPVDSVYQATQTLVDSFEQKFGARDCQDLLGCDIGTEQGQAQFKQQQLGSRCRLFTVEAAEMAAEIILKQ